MIRLLLTLLALMTGLAAQGAPASARVMAGDAAQVGAVQLARVGARGVARVDAARMLPELPRLPQVARPLLLRIGAVLAPATAIGIDRSHE